MPGLDRPIRVVYVGHVARLSGAELALSRLIDALGDRVEAHVVLAEDGPLVARLREVGATVTVLPLDAAVREVRRDSVAAAAASPRRLLAGARYLGRLVRLLRRIDPDVVHLNTLKAGVYGSVAARLAGVPCLWHVRDRLADDYLPVRTARAMRMLVRLLPDAAVANSQATLATVHPPRRGAAVVYNVVPPVGERAQQGEDDGGFRFGLVGRLAAWKGQPVFLRAIGAAFPDDPDVRAVLIGAPLFDGDDNEAELRALADGLGLASRVEFRGFREDVPAELTRLDALVHASTVPEPFGQVVLEGLAAGLPVVATREGGPSEIVTDGRDGLLYPAGDVDALADHLLAVRRDPALRERLGRAGRARAADFAAGRIAGQMLEVYGRMRAGERIA